MMQVVESTEYFALAQQYPIIDARSEAEWAQGHIPGSANVPILNNEHRKVVGTLYKQSGKEAAIMKGFQLAGPLFYDIFKKARKLARDRTLLLYCWRGGMRSHILAWMMQLADYKVYLLKGGYKAYRAQVHATIAQPWRLTVIGGPTGSGKTELLEQLRAAGAQVVNLEALAHHRGSAYGHIGLPPQPSVEYFENLLAQALQPLDVQQPVWIENESRFIGKVRIPDVFFSRLQAAPMVAIDMAQPLRKERIWAEYGAMPLPELLEATTHLEKKLGNERMRQACTALQAGDHHTWLDIVLHYYDKTYAHSTQQHKGSLHSFAPPTATPAHWVPPLLALNQQIWKQ